MYVSLMIGGKERPSRREKKTHHDGQDGRSDVGETPSLLFQRERGDEGDRVGRVRRVRVASDGVEHLRWGEHVVEKIELNSRSQVSKREVTARERSRLTCSALP